MCVIGYKPSDTEISKELLTKMWERNSDGAGFIARKSNSQEWVLKKGIMTYKDLEAEVGEYLGKDAELLLHLRIKSRGNISAELTHPFEFSLPNKEKRYIFHNGTVHLFAGADGCSDSKVLAELLTPISTRSVDKIVKNLVLDRMGKFVTFVQKEGKEAQIQIYEDAESKWEDGVWFSNLKHLEEKKVIIYGQNTGYSYNPQTSYYTPTPPDSNKNSELIDKVVDFYIKTLKQKDSLHNRQNIIEHYSLSMMCKRFLEDLIRKIEAGKTEDPILEYFEI